MDKKMRNAINNLTQDVLNLFDITIPINDMKEVVKKLGGTVIEDGSIGLYSDGYIEKELGEDDFYIVIPSNQSENRQNFTIAHELGHLFLHMGYMIDDEMWQKADGRFYRKGDSELEFQANEFAAALLMPRKEYKRVMDENTRGNKVLTSRIAEYFHVSVDAASYRGKWLGYLEW